MIAFRNIQQFLCQLLCFLDDRRKFLAPLLLCDISIRDNPIPSRSFTAVAVFSIVKDGSIDGPA